MIKGRIGIFFIPLLSAVLEAQEISWEWSRVFNSPEQEHAVAVTGDPVSKEFLVAVEWSGSLEDDLPGGTGTSAEFSGTYGGVDGLVARIDRNGNILWAFRLGSEGDDRISDIHLDEGGNFYVCGTMSFGSVNFSGTAPLAADSVHFNPGGEKAFLAKYDPAGRLAWARLAGGTGGSSGEGVSSGPGGVYLTGSHSGEISFGSLPGYSAAGKTDMFVVKYTPGGEAVWHVTGGSDMDDSGESVSCEDSGIFVAGLFMGNVLDLRDGTGRAVAPSVNTSGGGSDIFVMRMNVDGLIGWTRFISGPQDESVGAVVAGRNHLFVAGAFGGETNFPLYPENPVTQIGGTDAFLCALDKTDGSTAWVQTISGDDGGNEAALDVTTDGAGILYLTGFFTSRLVTPKGVYNSRGERDFFAASFSRTGEENWITAAGGPGNDQGSGVWAVPAHLYFVGEYGENALFQPLKLPGDSSRNMFVAKLKLDCVNAEGGLLMAADTSLESGETAVLVLKEYRGDIRWEYNLPGMDDWHPLTDELNDSIAFVPDTTADYRAYLTSGNCLPDSSNAVRIHVTDPFIPFADAGPDAGICLGDSVQLNASGGESYRWIPTSGIDRYDVHDPWARPASTTDYIVYVSRADGLSDSDTVTVTVHPLPEVDAGEDLRVCSGNGIPLGASGSGSFMWEPSVSLDDPALRNPVARVDTVTTFRVVLTDSNGCNATDHVTVFPVDPPIPYAGPDTTLIAQYSFRMEATLGPGETGNWKVVKGQGIFEAPASPVTGVSELELGENIFSWTVTNGVCPPAADQVTITVKDFLIPTVITPNGDGKNDRFRVEGIERFRSSGLVVLNRWGSEVFRSFPYRNDWQGTDQSGKELQEGTYYFILTLTDTDSRKGTVMIIR